MKLISLELRARASGFSGALRRPFGDWGTWPRPVIEGTPSTSSADKKDHISASPAPWVKGGRVPLSTAPPCCDKSIIYVIDPLDDSFPCPATGSTTHHSWQVLPVPYFYGFSLKFPRIKELRIPSISFTEGDDPPSPRPLTIPTRASRGGPKSTSRSWRNLAAAFWARMELRAPHRGGLVRGGGPTAPAATVTAWLPAPTWVGDGHRGLRVAADLGAVLGVEEVDGKLLELAVVEEGVYLCQLQQGHLHLLSGLPRLEDQFTLREDVVLEEKEEVCPR